MRHEELYEELHGNAPTVSSESSGTNWKDGVAATADALGAAQEAAARLNDYEARAKEVGERVGAAGTRLSVVRFLLPDEIRIYGITTARRVLMRSHGERCHIERR